MGGRSAYSLPMEERILNLLGRKDYTPLPPVEILRRLRLQPNQRHQLDRALQHLERTGQVARIKAGNRYALPVEADLVPGRLRVNRAGTGFLQPDDPKQPALRIPPEGTATAMHGDHVLVRKDLRPQPLRGRASGEGTGRVVRVLEAARTRLVGTLQESRDFLYVIPDDPRIQQDIYVAPPRDVGRPARAGDKVVVELREWKHRNVNPQGEIVEVLGPPDAEGVDMLSVLRQYDLPLHFPSRVLQEARAIGTQVKPEEVRGRVDCRGHLVVTIDPDDAKDFDDAFSLERGTDRHWKLRVHIADVSHYVKPGSALDVEAAKRGNSTYLVDRVIPMLPEALSNELCSLKPDVDRLTKCVEFLLTEHGQVLRTQFYPAVIRSRRRFTYREAFAILQQPPASELDQLLHRASALAQHIRRARFRAGSLNLDFPETKIRLDDRGRVARIERVENDLSHQLIEEFMLLANEAVAARLMSLNIPSLYRIHEAPDAKRLEEYREEVLSHRIACGNLGHRREVQKLLTNLDTLAVGQALKVLFLRSLMRARYAMEPLGHYGLAKAKYTHFTSPIRRYADLVVHRSLFCRPQPPATRPLKELGDHLSERERNSDDAERDSRDVKMFAYLQAQLDAAHPHPYPALVTDLRNFGFFVDVPDLGMSGLVPLSGLSDDLYQLDPQRAELVGRRTRRVFRLGDKVQVEVAKVDTFKRQVDFRLARDGQPARAAHPRTGHRPERRHHGRPSSPGRGRRR